MSEGCLNDLRTVAQAVGYQLRYQEVGGGSDGRPHQCSVSRGPGVNAILAKDFGANDPQGYFEANGYRSYICTEVTTSEWPSVRICTAHLSLPGQEWGGRDDHQEIECNRLRNTLNDTWSTSEFVIFAGNVNMGGNGQIAHCMPDSLGPCWRNVEG